jgi:hypothetical protein
MVETSDYRIPGSNAVTLSPALAKEIKERFARDRDNRFHIFLIAAGLRRTYLRTSEGGKDAYTPEFRKWYAENKLAKLFGQMDSSFVKYAAAGTLIEFVAQGSYFDTANRPANVPAPDPTPFLEALPLSMNALYELSIIKEKVDARTFRTLFKSKPSRQSVDQDLRDARTDDKRPLIHPHVTAAELLIWRKAWECPPEPKQKRTDKRTMLLAAVTVSGELFDFDKFGDHAGCVKLDEVYECLSRLHDLVSELDTEDRKFRVLSNRDYLEYGYKMREERSDPAVRVKLREDRKKRDAKFKAAAAKAKAAGKKPPKPKKAKPDLRKLQALDLSKVTGIIK